MGVVGVVVVVVVVGVGVGVVVRCGFRYVSKGIRVGFDVDSIGFNMDSGGLRSGSKWASIWFRMGFDKASNGFRNGNRVGFVKDSGGRRQGFGWASTGIWEGSNKDLGGGFGIWLRVGSDWDLGTWLAQKVGATSQKLANVLVLLKKRVFFGARGGPILSFS